jgi:hypothetical protein
VVTGLPAAWMYLMSGWALVRFVGAGFFTPELAPKLPADAVPWAALVLLALAVVLMVEAIRAFARPCALEAPPAPPAGPPSGA